MNVPVIINGLINLGQCDHLPLHEAKGYLKRFDIMVLRN